MLVILIFYLLVIVGLLFFYFSLLGSLRREAPFVPTGRKELQWILREVAKIKPGEVFYDLGSGDGRVVRAAARLGARAVGFEQSWVLTWWARFLNVILRPKAEGSLAYARFLCSDYLKENLSEANVIFCYLMPKAMERLKPKFESELKPGTRIVSRAFKVPGWTAVKRLQFSPRRPPVYVYVKQ